MPIPFRDADDLDELGAAGFLKIQSSSSDPAYLGALFLINARGEPLEFAYNRVEVPHTFLWRPNDLRRHAHRKLAASLLGICSRVPQLLLCLTDEVASELFCQDLQVSVPVGRVGQPLRAIAYSGKETQEVLPEPESIHLFWFPGVPVEGSIERRLFDRLTSHGLLLEPFDRAAIGLREVYSSDTGETP